MFNSFFRKSSPRAEHPAQSTGQDKGISRRLSETRQLRRIQVGMAIGLSIGLLVSIVMLLGWLNPYESRFADFLYRPHVPSGKVVLIAVDDKTLEEYGWPIEPITQGAFLYALLREEPRVIALDFLLPDSANKEENEFLATILGRAGKIVQPIQGIEVTRFPPIPGRFLAFDSLLSPASIFQTNNSTLAHAMIYADTDGIVRRVPLAINAHGQRYPAVGLAALALYQGRESGLDIQSGQVSFGDQRLPVDEHGQMLISYIAHDALPTVSYIDVARGRASPNLLRDKIVLVGPMTEAIPESYQVPSSVSDSRVFNIELQADLIESVLAGNFLRVQDPLVQVAAILVTAMLAGVTLPQLRWLYAAALTMVYFAIYLLYAFQQFDRGVIATPLYVGLGLLLVYALTMFYRYFSEERVRRFIGRTFLGMVAPEMVEQVLAEYDRGSLSLRGGRRDVTVLCANLRGLAPLSETNAPETIMELLTKYMTRITEAAFHYGGSVVRQSGTVLVATWNLPLDQPDHAPRAVSAAVEIQRVVSELNPSMREGQTVEVGLGIATGTVIAGHLSTSARASYAVIGDVVTLAERLSILASANQVLIDPATQDAMGEDFEGQVVHSIRVRGQRDPIPLWEVQKKTSVESLETLRSQGGNG